MATRRNAGKLAQPENFENALQELDVLVERMESGSLALDDLLSEYQRGAQLIAYCKDRLKSVEEQVQLFESGELKPFLNDVKEEGQ